MGGLLPRRARLVDRAAAAALIALAACGGAGGGGDDDDAPAIDGGVPGDGAADAAPLPVCVAGCAVAADCATLPAGTIGDADNYTCDGGRCVWRGCLSTAECTATYASSEYVCEAAFGAAVPTCWPTCAVAADCANEASPLLGVDNFACDGGKCRWTGCNDTAECTAGNQSPDWRCDDRGGDLPSCWPTCATAADCATASAPYDADNYACDDGLCVWTGCNTTAECMTVDPDWVCD